MIFGLAILLAIFWTGAVLLFMSVKGIIAVAFPKILVVWLVLMAICIALLSYLYWRIYKEEDEPSDI